MITSQSTLKLFKRLWPYIGRVRRLQFFGLLVLMVIASVAELMSIGALIPFLSALIDPNKLLSNELASHFLSLLGIFSTAQLIFLLTIVFVVAVILAALTRVMLIWASARISFGAGADLSNNIYRRTLYQPYEVHISRNSSDVISGIATKADGVIYGVITPILMLISSFVMLTFILTALILINPIIALTIFMGLGAVYALIAWVTRRRLLINGQKIAQESTRVIKSIQEGLGGIRDVLIDGNQEIYCDIYRRADGPLRMAQGNNLFISQSPRYVMEALGMVLIAVLAYCLTLQSDRIGEAIAILGVIALGAQKLLPVLQQGYSSWTAIQGSRGILQDVLDLLDQPLPIYTQVSGGSPIAFNKSIALENLSFRYKSSNVWILNKLNLSIKKGDHIGFIGKTGSGKSTLLDILMGLLSPSEGSLLIDGIPITLQNYRNWQAHIAHVPQSIFLSDGTVAENIAFGMKEHEINYERVRLAAEKAKISDEIESLPHGYMSYVGERGIGLSGGQLQRIGIARALYKKVDVMIFDEATSALDGETEKEVMHAVKSLSDRVTIFTVAHRLSTLSDCDLIVDLDGGEIKRIINYEDIKNE